MHSFWHVIIKYVIYNKLFYLSETATEETETTTQHHSNIIRKNSGKFIDLLIGHYYRWLSIRAFFGTKLFWKKNIAHLVFQNANEGWFDFWFLGF